MVPPKGVVAALHVQIVRCPFFHGRLQSLDSKAQLLHKQQAVNFLLRALMSTRMWFLQASLEVLLLRVWAYGLYRRFTAAHRAEVSSKALFRFKVFVGVLAA
jgi:hypothetical protein